MALAFCSKTQMHILQSLDVNTIFVVKEVFMNERSPSKMLQSQSEVVKGCSILDNFVKQCCVTIHLPCAT